MLPMLGSVLGKLAPNPPFDLMLAGPVLLRDTGTCGALAASAVISLAGADASRVRPTSPTEFPKRRCSISAPSPRGPDFPDCREVAALRLRAAPSASDCVGTGAAEAITRLLTPLPRLDWASSLRRRPGIPKLRWMAMPPGPLRCRINTVSARLVRPIAPWPLWAPTLIDTD